MALRVRLGLAFALLIVPGAVVAAACGGDDTAAPQSADAGDGSVAVDAPTEASSDAGTDATPPGIRGSIKVHGLNAKGRIFLGDGSKFNVEAPAANTVVTFTDPEIVGPQTVTFTTDPALGGLIVSTLAKVDVPEVWVDSSSEFIDVTPLADMNGTLSYPADPAITRIDISALLEHGYAGTDLSGAFPFTMQLHGPKSTTTIDVIGFGGNNASSRLLRAGLVSKVPVPAFVADAATPTMTVPNLELDHAFDQPVSFAVPNHALYGAQVVGTIRYARPSQELADRVFGADIMSTTESFAGPTGIVRSIAMTPPFDTFSRFVDVYVAGTDSSGRAFAPLGPTDTSITVNLVPAPSVTEPVTSPESAPDPLTPIAFAPGSKVSWTGDPAAQVTQVFMSGRGPAPTDGGSGFYFYWTVQLPKGETSFTSFELPANASPVRFLPKGPARVQVTTTTYPKTTVAEVFGVDTHAVKKLRNARGSVDAVVGRRFSIQ